jgi:twinkle protein
MANTLSRDACTSCGSSDNLATWEYQGKQFQKCLSPGCSAGKAKCISGGTEQARPNDRKYNDFSPVCNTSEAEFLTGIYQETRGLSLETCTSCGIMIQGAFHIFNYHEAQKVRSPDPKNPTKKKMFWQGNQKQAGLFMEHLPYVYEKPVIITEGEFDAASVYQAGYQAYSVNSGADSAAEEIQAKVEHLSKFKEIIFWFDSDSAGKKGLKKALEVDGLPLHKVKIVNCTAFKDANDVLIQDQKLGINDLGLCIEAAQEFTPEGLQRGSELDFNILEEPEEMGIPFAFEQLQECYHGLRPGEILLIGAGSGAGKSLFSKHLALYWMQHVKNLRIANIFLEEKQKFTLQSLLGLHLKKPAFQLVEKPYAGLAEEGRKLLGSDQYYFDNHFGSLQSKQLFQKIRYLAFKTDVIILDHISIIVSGMDSKDERKDIDKLMTTIKTIAVETGCRFVLISHLRRANGDNTYEQGAPITSNSFRGSHALYQLSDSVIALERNQQDALKKNMVQVRGLKNRFKGDVGLLDELYYNNDTGCLTSLGDLFK